MYVQNTNIQYGSKCNARASNQRGEKGKKNYVRNLAACEVTFQDITDSISNLIYILFTLAGKNT